VIKVVLLAARGPARSFTRSPDKSTIRIAGDGPQPAVARLCSSSVLGIICVYVSGNSGRSALSCRTHSERHHAALQQLNDALIIARLTRHHHHHHHHHLAFKEMGYYKRNWTS